LQEMQTDFENLRYKELLQEMEFSWCHRLTMTGLNIFSLLVTNKVVS